MKVIAPRMPRLATSGTVMNDRTPSSSIRRRCASSRAIWPTISSVISGTSCASPERTTEPAPYGASSSGGYRWSSADQVQHVGVGVSGCEAFQAALLRDHVDQHLVGKRRNSQLGEPLQRRLVLEGRAEELTGPGQER